MASQPVHTKIINSVAKEILRPMGVCQRGRSRFWYDDAKWYATAIEFQPSGWSKGSYLNIGVHWLWYPKSYWSFDLGYRECGFVEFKDEDQFRKSILSLAQLAAARVHETRARFETLSDTYSYVLQQEQHDWSYLHLGILAALSGHVKKGRSFVSKAAVKDTEFDWELERNLYIESLLRSMDNADGLRQWVEKKISKCRTLLRLKDLSTPRLPIR